MSDNDFKRNASGYFDPTTFEAAKKKYKLKSGLKI